MTGTTSYLCRQLLIITGNFYFGEEENLLKKKIIKNIRIINYPSLFYFSYVLIKNVFE